MSLVPSSITNVNRRGRGIDPWWTPTFISHGSNLVLSTIFRDTSSGDCMGFWLGGRFVLIDRKYALLRRRASMDRFGNVLFNSVLQPLEGMAYIPTVKVVWDCSKRTKNVTKDRAPWNSFPPTINIFQTLKLDIICGSISFVYRNRKKLINKWRSINTVVKYLRAWMQCKKSLVAGSCTVQKAQFTVAVYAIVIF